MSTKANKEENTIIEVSEQKLRKIIDDCWDRACPSGEYWMGKADLANELLGNPPINWDTHPKMKEVIGG